MSEPSVFDTISSLYDSFYEQEKKVAAYILEHPEEVIHMTISELAKANSTSVATVTRLCRKCSLDGFHHLKISLARDLAVRQGDLQPSHTISMDDIGGSLAHILENKTEELKQTILSMDQNQLKEVIAVIQKASLVQFMAVGNTIPPALDGAYKFNEIGIRAVAGTIWETQLCFASSLTEQDVLIALSNSGESLPVVQAAEQAKKRGAKVIGITNNPHSSVADLSDYHLTTVTKEKLFMNEFYFSRVSLMTVIEILYLLLVSANENSYTKLSECEQLIAGTKI